MEKCGKTRGSKWRSQTAPILNIDRGNLGGLRSGEGGLKSVKTPEISPPPSLSLWHTAEVAIFSACTYSETDSHLNRRRGGGRGVKTDFGPHFLHSKYAN
jgi:hypothetical protein